jgi:membrane protease YdiL (CAAX protease family)
VPVLPLTAVSLYFAALHWPQGPTQIAAALLGSMVLGYVLWRRRNFPLIAGLHILFNWRLLLI